MFQFHNNRFNSPLRVMSLLLALIALSGCGGGSSESGGGTPPAQVSATVSLSQPKVLSFSWNDVAANHYKLLKNPDGSSGYTQVGANITTTSVDETIGVHIQDWVNASYIVQSCNALGDCTDSAAITATVTILDAIGYFKASNTGGNDNFGWSIALSTDGNTLAVGAIGESSAATAINGDASDNSASRAGAVYLFSRSGGSWSQQAYIKASNTDAGDQFGSSVALSADGNSLAVGAYGESSAATAIDGDASDNNASNAGAVYLFSRSGSSWSQQAYIKASNTDAGDQFGSSVALSADGNSLAVVAPTERSAATGINGDASDNNANGAGAVYLFNRTGSSWSQQAYIKASNTDAGDFFGTSVALSADGNSLAVGAFGEGSAATGVNGDASDNSDNSVTDAGAVYLY